MLRVRTSFDTEISEDSEFTERGVAGLGLTGAGREGVVGDPADQAANRATMMC